MSVLVQFESVGQDNRRWQTELAAWDEALLAQEAAKASLSRGVLVEACIRDDEPVADIVAGIRVVAHAILLSPDPAPKVQEASTTQGDRLW